MNAQPLWLHRLVGRAVKLKTNMKELQDTDPMQDVPAHA